MSPIETKIYFSENLEIFQKQKFLKSYPNVFFIVDKNTKKHCWSLIKSNFSSTKLFTVNPGEDSKNINTVFEIWNWLNLNNANKNDLLINLGGGVVSDIGGFAASVYKRGMNFANIPTTFMAMVDASIGGKNGVDLNAYKNVLGTIVHPDFILIDSTFLKTLNQNDYNNGWAEVIKHKVLNGKLGKFEIEHSNAKAIKTIKESVKYKMSIVKLDQFDLNKRKTLNFGHTIGHAVESWFLNKKKKIGHGYAISVGLICELYLSVKLLEFPMKELERIKELLFQIFPKIALPDFDELEMYLNQDKKNKGQGINFCLMKNIGSPMLDIVVDKKNIRSSLKYYESLN